MELLYSIAQNRDFFSTAFLSCHTMRRTSRSARIWSVANTDWWSKNNAEFNPLERAMWMSAHLLGE